jgi:hypothetical protein
MCQAIAEAFSNWGPSQSRAFRIAAYQLALCEALHPDHQGWINHNSSHIFPYLGCDAAVNGDAAVLV